MYSGHDTTVHAINRLFGLGNQTCLKQKFNAKKEDTNQINCIGRPDFAYNIRIDFLRGRGGQFFVEYYYNGIPIDICGSKKPEIIYGARCDYPYFKKLIKSLIIPKKTLRRVLFRSRTDHNRKSEIVYLEEFDDSDIVHWNGVLWVEFLSGVELRKALKREGENRVIFCVFRIDKM